VGIGLGTSSLPNGIILEFCDKTHGTVGETCYGDPTAVKVAV